MAGHWMNSSTIIHPRRRAAVNPNSDWKAGLPGPTLGIVGGGQLARMTTLSAVQLGCAVKILGKTDPGTASFAQIFPGTVENDLVRFAAECDLVIFENEFVDADLIQAAEEAGHLCRPGSETFRRVQDKFLQKQTLSQAGLPVAPYREVRTQADILAAGSDYGWPLVLKQRRNGYDGKGNYTVRDASVVEEAWQAMGAGRRGLYIEEFCPFTMEVATIITRGLDGQMVRYPVVETIQEHHVCHVVKAPAAVSPAVASQALAMAAAAVEAIDAVGSVGVEMFVTGAGQVLINEMAPRVHNSGHYSIEGSFCSQFENHVRAVIGWPLGDPGLVTGAAVMVNLLGVGPGPGQPSGLSEALAVPGAHIHLYGKDRSGLRRKMGHVTALGATVEQALARAESAANHLRFGELS